MPVGDFTFATPLRRIVAFAAVIAGIAIAGHRGLVSHPSSELLFVLLPVGVLVADSMMSRPSDSRWRLSVVSVIVLASIGTLMVIHPVGDGFATFLFMLLCAQAGARYRTCDSVAVLAATLVVPLVLDVTAGTHASANTAIGVCFAWSVAAAFRSRQDVVDELQTAQRKLSERAAVDERRRIAREVHDLLAHTLSVTMLHLTGARLALQDGQTAEALQALEQAESGGRDAMREVRRTVGLLSDARQPDNALPGAPEVAKIVQEYRLAGMRLAFHLDGDLDRLPRDTGLAIYRIAQESLANAAKHSPGSSVRMRISVQPAAVHITVTSPRIRQSLVPSGGRGLAGMAERAALAGGTVTAGPIGNEWEVYAVIPTSGR